MVVRRWSTAGQILILVSLAVLVVGINAIWSMFQRTNQVRTFDDLRSIVKIVEEVRAHETGKVTPRLVESAISQVHSGLDDWGNPFRYEVFENDGDTSYVILSCGNGGEPDITPLRRYAEVSPQVVAGDYSRDIVFVDGEAILNAGK